MLSRRARWTFQVLALMLLLVFLIWAPATYNIIGKSMMPNLHDDSYAMVVHQNYSINRFDIVIVNRTKEPPLVKRVVGLPGEQVMYINGHLFINGKEIDEPFLPDFRLTRIEVYHFRLAADQYVVLGDNRPDSFDSRAFGPVKRESIKGKVIFRIW